MHCFRKFCFALGPFLACNVQADTIPTLTATSAEFSLMVPSGTVSGPDFGFGTFGAYAPNIVYPCAVPTPAGGCVAPGPIIYLQPPNASPLGGFNGFVTLDGIMYGAVFLGNAQIQYLTPTIVYPDLPASYSITSADIPVVLSGSFTACLQPESDFDFCLTSDQRGQPLPGYPKYLANISVNVPGIMHLDAIGRPDLNGAILEISFSSTPIPEPGVLALACLGFSVLIAAYKRRGKRTPV